MIALQLVGSTSSKLFFDLSILYAKKVTQPKGFELLFVVAYPDGKWTVTKNIEQRDEIITLQKMMDRVQHAALVIPHMFCEKGLTSLRILFEDTLQIPLVGSSGHVLKKAQDKYLTKIIAHDIGIQVPKGIKLTTSTDIQTVYNSLNFPLIVKPNFTDNSDGLSLVQSSAELEAAVAYAFSFDNEILVESYIDGREIRGAILELNGKFITLPFIEYGVNSERPIRQRADKYKFNDEGDLLSQSEKIYIPATCPALVNQTLQVRLNQMMIAMHKSLGCRDFSMFDFRIDALTGQPYLLEAGLFWSFSESSMISNMIQANDEDLEQITQQIWLQTIKRRK